MEMLALIVLLFASLAFAQTGAVNIIGGKVDLSTAVHTLPMIVVANAGALPASGCTIGELAIVTSATLGQQLYQNSGSGTCIWTQQLNSGTATGGGITMYSATGLTVTANTYYIPIGGGGSISTTEANVDIDSPAAATITNMFVQLSVALGGGNSGVFTMRKAGVSQSVTCTISGASATSCSDTTHSFNVSQGDLLTIQLVTTGTIIVTPNIMIASQFGNITATGTVNTGTTGQLAYYASNGAAISGTTAAPNGTTATTQTTGDGTNQLATDAFVANAIASTNTAQSVQAATIAVLSNTPTYSNGTAGVGATLTAASNGVLTIDGYTVLLNDRVLIKNQASALQNGVYTLTTLGTVSVPYVLTRAPDSDTVSALNYAGTVPVLQGSTLSNTGWNLNCCIVAIGTTSLVYTQSTAGTGGVPSSGNVKGQGNFSANHLITGAGGKTIQDSQSVGFYSGTASMGTSAISSGTCASAVTVSAPGVTTANVIIATPTADATGVTGYAPSATGSLYIWAYPTANNVNFKVCNNTSGSITPSALTLGWRAL